MIRTVCAAQGWHSFGLTRVGDSLVSKENKVWATGGKEQGAGCSRTGHAPQVEKMYPQQIQEIRDAAQPRINEVLSAQLSDKAKLIQSVPIFKEAAETQGFVQMLVNALFSKVRLLSPPPQPCAPPQSGGGGGAAAHPRVCTRRPGEGAVGAAASAQRLPFGVQACGIAWIATPLHCPALQRHGTAPCLVPSPVPLYRANTNALATMFHF